MDGPCRPKNPIITTGLPHLIAQFCCNVLNALIMFCSALKVCFYEN